MGRRWSDHYTQKAKSEGFGARSVYKLTEIDRRFQILKKRKRVLDLGCHPGSWSQLVAKRLPTSSLVGIDLTQTPDYPGRFFHASVAEIEANAVVEALGGHADLVISDMAPNTTGNRLADHVAQLEVVQMGHELMKRVIAPGGHAVFKIFEGEDAAALVEELRQGFTRSKRLRPDATRKQSREFFFVGLDWQG